MEKTKQQQHADNAYELFTRSVDIYLKNIRNRLTVISQKDVPQYYKPLHEYVADISQFIGTFNRRPDKDIYYSEKILTYEQKQEYEEACTEVARILHTIGGTIHDRPNTILSHTNRRADSKQGNSEKFKKLCPWCMFQPPKYYRKG